MGVVLEEGNVHAESFSDGVNLHVCVSTMTVSVVLSATFHV